MTYEVVAVSSAGREVDAWIVEAFSRVDAVRKVQIGVLPSSGLPVDDYTFKTRPCRVDGKSL